MSAARQSAVTLRIEAILHAWLQAWALDHGQLNISNAPQSTLNEGSFYQSSTEADLALYIEGSFITALTGLPRQGGDGLEAHVEVAALADLEARLLGVKVETLPPMNVIEQLPESLLDPRWGGCRIDACWGGTILSILVGQTLTARWVPLRVLRQEQLSTRHEAIGAERVRLVAHLELGEIALAELHDLREGDVIVTQAPLNTPANISLTGCQFPLIHGRLGEQEGRRACLLLGTEVLEVAV